MGQLVGNIPLQSHRFCPISFKIALPNRILSFTTRTGQEFRYATIQSSSPCRTGTGCPEKRVCEPQGRVPARTPGKTYARMPECRGGAYQPLNRHPRGFSTGGAGSDLVSGYFAPGEITGNQV